MSEAPTPPTENTQDLPKWAEERLAKVAAQRSEALERVAALESELETMKPLIEGSDELREKLAELQKTHDGASTTWTKERALLEMGIKDADIRDLFQWQYDKAPEDGRPDFGEWLKGLTAESAPASLRGHLPTSGEIVVPPVETEAPVLKTELPKSENGTKTAPVAKPNLSADDIRASTKENWESIRERLKSEFTARR